VCVFGILYINAKIYLNIFVVTVQTYLCLFLRLHIIISYFTVIAYVVPVLFACGHFISDIDSIMPFNQSRSYQLLILAEYFVDNEKYFYFIVLHATVCFFIFQITLMSTTSIYVTYIQHVCGMFRIAR